MECPQCHHPNPLGATRCAKCNAPLSASDSGPGISTGGWSIQKAPAEGATSAFVSSASIQPGTVLGERYEIIKLLGEGGMGAVYKAKDRAVDRFVALKVIRSELAFRPEILQRFKQELVLARQITHKNVIRIFDLGEADGIKFISMDFVEGQDLKSLVREKEKLAPEVAKNLIIQVCRALNAAHSEGVIHRDLKPQNIMVDSQGRVTVMDFGIARSMEKPGLTQTGMVIGTPEYMSPEQGKGETVDGRSDIYSLGVIFYELLTGKTPHQADTALAIMLKRTQEIPRPPAELDPTIPASLNQLVMKCLEIDRARRYQSAREILGDLEARTSTRTALTAAAPAVGWKDILRAHKLAAAVAAGIAVSLLIVAVIAFRLKNPSKPKAAHAPVSVLVADFTNHTGDPIFDDTLEPMVNFALEGASFINAYNRENAHKLAQKLPQPADKLDEQSARLVAVNQGVSAVITGELSRRGDNYSVSATALDSVTGNVLAQAEVTAANKDEVLLDIPKLVAPIRKALGDTTPESAQIEIATGAFTAANLEAVHQYGVAKKQEAAGEFTEALQAYSRAAELDPNFARAYSGMASISGNLGRVQDAEKYVKLAMKHVDRMTERERYRTRGIYYLRTENWQKCVEEYSEFVNRYPADNVGQYNLSGCFMAMRNVPKAVEAARRAAEITPRSALERVNLSFYSTYSGDFQTGEREARAALGINPSPFAYLALAEAQLGQEQMSQAAETYHKQEKLGALGSSMAISGFADLALYEGRLADAVRVLEQGAAADLAAKNPENAADKFAHLGRVQLLRGQRAAAVAATEKALANSRAVQVRFLAAQTFVEAGEMAKAQKLAAALGSELQAEPQSYAKIIEGMIAGKRGDTQQAIAALTDATKLLDTWISHFELGRAYLEAGLFVEASSEFDRCIKRRGEALELFMNNVPTIGYFPLIYYYQGRVVEGLKSPGYAEPYRTYLSIRGKSTEDPLLPEIRRRIGQ